MQFNERKNLKGSKNQALYHEILLLQKFNDISWKVLCQKKSLQPQKKMRRFFSFKYHFLEGLQKNIPLGLIHIKSAKSGLFMLSVNSENQNDLF